MARSWPLEALNRLSDAAGSGNGRGSFRMRKFLIVACLCFWLFVATSLYFLRRDGTGRLIPSLFKPSEPIIDDQPSPAPPISPTPLEPPSAPSPPSPPSPPSLPTPPTPPTPPAPPVPSEPAEPPSPLSPPVFEVKERYGLLHPEEHGFREAKTLYFDWNVTAGFRAPDGVKRRVYLVNDAFPGPLIEARSGDILVINVHNALDNEGVSLHWHGLKLLEQNKYDGAVGITQCPIPAGESYTYTIKLGDAESGTFWWHGHDHLQRGDGLFGGLVVHEPRNRTDNIEEMNIEERLLLIGDWFHRTAQDVHDWYESGKSFAQEPVPDSMLINGRGDFDCARLPNGKGFECTEQSDRLAFSGILDSWKGEARDVRLRIVNVGNMAGFHVAIPGAVMTPIEVDGGSKVNASSANGVGIVYPGERIDVLLQEDKMELAHDQRLLISLDDENMIVPNPALERNQTFLLYGEDPVSGAGQAMTWPADQQYVDLYSLKSSEPPSWTTEPIDITREDPVQLLLYARTQSLAHNDNKPFGYFNGTSWRPQSTPLAYIPREDWDANQFVPFIPLSWREGVPNPFDADTDDSLSSSSSISPPKWVDITINNLDDGSHPFHLHGHKFYVLTRFKADPDQRDGYGSFNPFKDDEPPAGMNLEAPLLKDTVDVPRRGHVVIRFLADNPGIWMLHCHMLVHLSTGMGISLHVGEHEEYQEEAVVAMGDMDRQALCR